MFRCRLGHRRVAPIFFRLKQHGDAKPNGGGSFEHVSRRDLLKSRQRRYPCRHRFRRGPRQTRHCRRCLRDHSYVEKRSRLDF